MKTFRLVHSYNKNTTVSTVFYYHRDKYEKYMVHLRKNINNYPVYLYIFLWQSK